MKKCRQTLSLKIQGTGGYKQTSFTQLVLRYEFYLDTYLYLIFSTIQTCLTEKTGDVCLSQTITIYTNVKNMVYKDGTYNNSTQRICPYYITGMTLGPHCY